MVVLEGGGKRLPSSNNQYLQPDYLSSLPITLDAKNSPLALLAQTCSQIGVDTPIMKSSNPTTEKSTKLSVIENTRSSPTEGTKSQKQESLSSEHKLKSCEKNIVIKKSDIHMRPKCSVQNFVEEKPTFNSERETVSPASSSYIVQNCDSETTSPELKSISPTRSPADKSANEIIQEHLEDSPSCIVSPAELITSNSGGHLGSSGMEQTNPAFRSSFPGAAFNFNQHSPLFSTGYTSTSSGLYSNYIRGKTPSSGESFLSVCKDPYCTGCQFNLHNQQILMSGMSGPCPSNCSQCDHQKYNLALSMSLVPGTIPSSLTYTPIVRPYVCNWMLGDTYCGKRFVTSEELLQHLRSHTNGIDTTSVATSSTSSLLNPLSLFTTSSLNRPNYLNAINPLSSSRYHPYSKTSLQTLMGSSYSAFSPTLLGSYYTPYTVYNQRSGAAIVHP